MKVLGSTALAVLGMAAGALFAPAAAQEKTGFQQAPVPIKKEPPKNAGGGQMIHDPGPG